MSEGNLAISAFMVSVSDTPPRPPERLIAFVLFSGHKLQKVEPILYTSSLLYTGFQLNSKLLNTVIQ